MLFTAALQWVMKLLLDWNERVQPTYSLSRSSDMRSMSRLREPAEYVSKAKHRWAGHTMRRIDDVDKKNSGMDSSRSKTSSRGPPSRWADVFVARMDQLNLQLVTSDVSGPRASPLEFNTNIVDDASERQKRINTVL
ncbi:unnamed protein product [Strongylus vulgaris]|uniref:Uncharacterized protein n=1 Tax=Strongylus vulgaris TaxID=40348 RepID=A0A3P7LCI7_STRVU|nr:unnamed protein product [Strongylus vulgaris]